jgi:hypothetical protein
MARLFCALMFAVSLHAADVAVPSACTPEVNRRLMDLLKSGAGGPVDNVMVCGQTISSSRPQNGRGGDHQILPLQVRFPDGSSKLIEVVTNDELDGRVTAPPHASVLAYGQAFFDNTRRFAAGIHDVHCATHRGADNGWVVVNGARYPESCGGFQPRRQRRRND